MCNRGPFDTMGNKFYEETLQCWSELQEVKTPTANIIYNQTIWKNRYKKSRIDPLSGDFGKKMVSRKFIISYATMGNVWTITKSRKCTALTVISSMFYKSDKVFLWTGVSWLKIKQSRPRSMLRSLISVASLLPSWLQQRICYITNSWKTNT